MRTSQIKIVKSKEYILFEFVSFSTTLPHSDGEESDDDEHYNAGLSEFLEQVKQRKKLRAKDPQR